MILLNNSRISPQKTTDRLRDTRSDRLSAVEFSAHGLRLGYLTETARRGIPLIETMQQPQHRSVQQAARDYNEVERQRGRVTRVI